MKEIPKFADIKAVKELLEEMSEEVLTGEYAVIKNPSYVYAPLEFYPLAPKQTEPLDRIVAVAMDMDGTTTTTEPLCLHSLEYMLRKITGRMHVEEWKGLDHVRDYPNIIGNSTTRHVEYLIRTYGEDIKENELRSSYVEAAVWMLAHAKDQRRKKEAYRNCMALGLGGLFSDPEFERHIESPEGGGVEYFCSKYGGTVEIEGFENTVKAAVDIYYARYHYILSRISLGEGERIAQEMLCVHGGCLIEPMPGIPVYLLLIKGMLTEEDAGLCDVLLQCLRKKGIPEPQNGREKFLRLIKYFSVNPCKVAVVTSSVEYEADIVLREVFYVIRYQVSEWKISEASRKKFMKSFSSYKDFYDSVITASDSSEIRLKPHRDLYSVALYQMSVPVSDFKYCVGFEDSESGTIAIRAAGIGLCAAVPFAHTSGHNLDAASVILNGGMAEAVLYYNAFIK